MNDTTVGRESLIMAGTLGVATLAQSGSVAAQVGHTGIQGYNLTSGGVSLNNGINAIWDGNYLQGSLDILSGTLRIGGTVGSQLAVGQLGAPAGMTRVTSWASPGVPPDLNAGRWVQVGGPTYINYQLTGVIEKGVPFNNSVTGFIPSSSLSWPSGREFLKGLFGQRVIQP